MPHGRIVELWYHGGEGAALKRVVHRPWHLHNELHGLPTLVHTPGIFEDAPHRCTFGLTRSTPRSQLALHGGVCICVRAQFVRVCACMCAVPCVPPTDVVFKRSRRATHVLHGGREVWSVDGGGSARVVGFVSFASGATSLSLL